MRDERPEEISKGMMVLAAILVLLYMGGLNVVIGAEPPTKEERR